MRALPFARWTSSFLMLVALSSLAAGSACTSLNNGSDGGTSKVDGGGSGGRTDGGATGGGSGAAGNGGAATGGAGGGQGGATAGAGGARTGGAATGGAATGGAAAGGAAAGGAAAGGTATGGVATGGKATGGIATGGVATGGTATGGGTGGLSCSSGQTICSNTCVNLQTQATNCGTCGHDCLGGTCSAGQCQPQLIGRYDRSLGFNGVSLGDSHVYGKGETNLAARAKKDGTDFSATSYLPTLFASACAGGGLAEVNGRIYYQWYDGSVCRMAVCSPTDCDGSTVGFSPAVGASYVQSFAADRVNGKVYWYDGASKRFLGATAPASGMPVVTTVSSSDIEAPSWTGYAAGGILYLNTTSTLATVTRLPASGGIAVPIASATQLNTGSLWATSARLYFSDGTSINYVTLPAGTGGPTKVTTGAARFLWSDDTDLYWVPATSEMTLQMCKVANCAATTKIVHNASCIIEGIRGEANAVYWGGYGGCQLPGTSTLDNMQLWKLAR